MSELVFRKDSYTHLQATADRTGIEPALLLEMAFNILQVQPQEFLDALSATALAHDRGLTGETLQEATRSLAPVWDMRFPRHGTTGINARRDVTIPGGLTHDEIRREGQSIRVHPVAKYESYPRPLVALAQAPGGLLWAATVFASPFLPGVQRYMIFRAGDNEGNAPPVALGSVHNSWPVALKYASDRMHKLIQEQSGTHEGVVDERPAVNRGSA